MADLEFNKNDDKMRLLISDMKRKHAKVALGGGKKKIEKQQKKGKLTARERIDYLKDKSVRIENIPGLWYFDKDKNITSNKPSKMFESLDGDLPGQAWKLLDMTKYT